MMRKADYSVWKPTGRETSLILTERAAKPGVGKYTSENPPDGYTPEDEFFDLLARHRQPQYEATAKERKKKRRMSV